MAGGVLRALELLGLAQHVTKLSVVAGSAWASCAYVRLGGEVEDGVDRAERGGDEEEEEEQQKKK